MCTSGTATFNRTGAVVEGWYWALRSRSVKKGKIKAVCLMGRDLVIFRNSAGAIAALDAYCPHMGAHLAQGSIKHDTIRCFFHGWRFDANGQCVDIPCLEGNLPSGARLRSHPVCEQHGLVWVWVGDTLPDHDPPAPPELRHRPQAYLLGRMFRKKCHPNVVMVNAIDEQHFRTVHQLPGDVLTMDPAIRSRHNIEFRNTGRVPREKWFGRLVARFYKGPLTYELSYWYGSVGTVCLGPDFLHFYLMFALRQTPEGHTEGQAIFLTKKRRGPWGWVVNRLVLWTTRMISFYFATGDTKLFETIRFNLKTPIPADRAVMSFIRHVEQQSLTEWSDGRPAETPVAQRGRMVDVAL